MKKWYVEYYSRSNLVKQKWIYAESRIDAVKTIRETDTIVELICCIEVN